MIHIAVCDDQQNDREYIILLVNHFFETSDFDVEIVAFESGQKLIEHCQTKPLDMVFLDIYLVDENGIEVAKKLREISSDCLLIFTTQSHADFHFVICNAKSRFANARHGTCR